MTEHEFSNEPDGVGTYLRRLNGIAYQGSACVHWSLTIQDRQQGWLVPLFYARFRELLTHTTFRYGLCCPIYCCMPDHIHLLWLGLHLASDQRVAMKYFRRHLNWVLGTYSVTLQKQAFDHLLRPDDRPEDGFKTVVDYIARNPERAKLVKIDEYDKYPFTGSLIPGFPEVSITQPDYWDRFERIIDSLRKNGFQKCARGVDE